MKGNKTPHVHRRGVPHFSFAFRGKMDDYVAEVARYAQLAPPGRPPSVSKDDQAIFIIPVVDELGQRLISRWENSFLKGYANVGRIEEGILRGFEGCGAKVAQERNCENRCTTMEGRPRRRKSGKEPTSREERPANCFMNASTSLDCHLRGRVDATMSVIERWWE